MKSAQSRSPSEEQLMTVDPVRAVSPRALAIAAILCFVLVVINFALAPGAFWADYPGILFHLAMFLLIAKLPAPEWARAAGYGWLVLDVMIGALTLNHVPHDIADYVRLGGHIFAGIWLVTAALSGSRPFSIVGVLGPMSGLLPSSAMNFSRWSHRKFWDHPVVLLLSSRNRQTGIEF